MTHSSVVGCSVGLRTQHLVAIDEALSERVSEKIEDYHSKSNPLKLFGAELTSVVGIQKLGNSDNQESQRVRT